MSVAAGSTAAPDANRVIDVRTPFGRPVGWAEVAMVTDIGDSHELNDDRCLVITSRDLSAADSGAAGEFMLCLLADGASGSTFATGDESEVAAQAGWRASQLAQAAFVERFLGSFEVDMLDRIKEGLRAADRALVESNEGSLSTTLTALYLAGDGTAYAASIGDSVLLVLPPSRRTAADRRLKKLGYEDSTAVGSGDTTLSYVDEGELIEQWWPNKENDPVDMRVKPGTYFVLLSDGISDNLPADFIDHLVHHHTLDRATVGLPRHTRERRAQMQKVGGGSTTELGLDNMSAIVVRFDGLRKPVRAVPTRLEDARLFSMLGCHGGPERTGGGNFGMVCLAGQQFGATLVPTFLRGFLEADHEASMPDRFGAAYVASMPIQGQARFAALGRDEAGAMYAFSAGLPDLTALFAVDILERTVEAARDSAFQRFIYSPRLWASSLAAFAVFLLVSTAFATGTVRPAPPPAPTQAAGEPTPTPDTRPHLALGGFLLVGPPEAPTATPSAPATPEVLSVRIEAAPTEPPPDEQAAEQPTSCANPLGLLCDAPPPPPRAPPRNPPPRAPAPARPPARQATADSEQPQDAQQPASDEQPSPESCTNLFGIGCPESPSRPAAPPHVIPVASPAPAGSADAGPPAGSNLDRALRIASVANDQFNKSLEENSADSAESGD
jgi:serine/threonine protein phosphatase PrpC